MIIKRTLLLSIFSLYVLNPSYTYGILTTMQHWDANPVFSANDSMVPASSHFLNLIQAKYKNEKPNKKRAFGINFTGFIQGAVTATGYSGCESYGSVCGTPQNGFEMGDFRGTLYPMGLFLGCNPNNGKNIWVNGIDDGLATNITPASIADLELPDCLERIALHFAGYSACVGQPKVASCASTQANPLVLNNATTGTVAGPSIFNAATLAQDTLYFGAFSLPIKYKKQGFRLEANLALCDYLNLTIQSGIANIQQKFTPEFTATSTGSSQTNLGPYSLSNITPTSSGTTPPSTTSATSLYNQLNYTTATNVAAAQAKFNTYISNNLANILNPSCGANQGAYPVDTYSFEDVRCILTLQLPYLANQHKIAGEEDEDDDTWQQVCITPYLSAGATFPVAECTDYENILSLPFGNNGHMSAGGTAGITFDFSDSIEVGVAGGATYFLSKEETRPFPTHPLQRLLYPFETNVITQPGLNWHLNAMISAYQFMPHINFWLTYALIEHRQDQFTVCDKTKAEYFCPQVLEKQSDWKAQFFTAGLSFNITPHIQASIAWQQPISPRNAYVPVSISGSLSGMF